MATPRAFPLGRIAPDAGDAEEALITDMLIRDVPDEAITAIDAHEVRLGLLRSEYVRR